MTRERQVKQVIVIRRDLKMRQGKAVAQGAHAAMMFLLDGHELKPVELEWLESGIAKICLQVPDLDALNEIFAKAKAAGITAHSITDRGDTEFHGVPTLTCIAIGPDYTEKIDPITGDLKLL